MIRSDTVEKVVQTHVETLNHIRNTIEDKVYYQSDIIVREKIWIRIYWPVHEYIKIGVTKSDQI